MKMLETYFPINMQYFIEIDLMNNFLHIFKSKITA